MMMLMRIYEGKSSDKLKPTNRMAIAIGNHLLEQYNSTYIQHIL